jgi:hypothetical protein
MFRGSVKSTGYPLRSPVSPSLPLPYVTVCHHISAGVYLKIILLLRPIKCTVTWRKIALLFWNFICMLFGRNVEFATCKEVDRSHLSEYFECLNEYLMWIGMVICDWFGDIPVALLDKETIKVYYGIVIWSVLVPVIQVRTEIMQPCSTHGLKYWYYVTGTMWRH